MKLKFNFEIVYLSLLIWLLLRRLATQSGNESKFTHLFLCSVGCRMWWLLFHTITSAQHISLCHIKVDHSVNNPRQRWTGQCQPLFEFLKKKKHKNLEMNKYSGNLKLVCGCERPPKIKSRFFFKWIVPYSFRIWVGLTTRTAQNNKEKTWNKKNGFLFYVKIRGGGREWNCTVCWRRHHRNGERRPF